MTLIVKQTEPNVIVAKAPIYKWPSGFVRSANLTIQEASSGAADVATNSGFFSGPFNRDSPTAYNWVSKYGVCIDSNPVTIIDLTGQAGTLTNIVTPTGEAGTIITTTYEIDGVLYSFQHTVEGVVHFRRFWGGNFDGVASVTDSTTAIHPGRGSFADIGWNSSQSMGLFSPLQNRGSSIGIPFTNSLKVTIQSTEFSATEARNFGGAAYVRT